MNTVGLLLIFGVVVLLCTIWFRRRTVFLYPSTWILFLSTLLYLVPALAFSDEIADISPYTVTAALYCAVLVLGGLLVNLLRVPPSFAPDAVDVEVTNPDGMVRATLNFVLLALGLITLWYLASVPLRSTGLYGVLFDPENAAQLREESLKLIDSVALHYVYLVGFSALCPLAFALVLARAPAIARPARWFFVFGVLAFLSFYVLLTGARVGLVNLAVVGMMFGIVKGKLTIRAKPLLLMAAVIFVVPMAMSVLREQGRNEATVLEYFSAIGERIFLLPLLISGWFVEYAEVHGQVGLAAAMGLGVKVDWSNTIALEYLDRKDNISFESVTTPTAFFFANYLYFGWLGLLPSWVALYLIDLPIRWAWSGPQALRVPFVATFLFFSVLYVQTTFGTTMLSHGYVLLAGSAWFLARRRNLRESA